MRATDAIERVQAVARNLECDAERAYKKEDVLLGRRYQAHATLLRGAIADLYADQTWDAQHKDPL